MTRGHGERGATMVETAIALSAVLMLTFGIIDCGRALYTRHLVDNAARLGARFAIVRGHTCVHTASGADPWPCPTPVDGTDIRSFVQQQSNLLGLGQVTVNAPLYGDPANPGNPNVGCSPTDYPQFNGPGCEVTVTVSYDFNFLMPFLPAGTIPMTSSSSMLISQ